MKTKSLTGFQMTSKIKIYYHIWAENNYKSVFEAHMDHIKKDKAFCN